MSVRFVDELRGRLRLAGDRADPAHVACARRGGARLGDRSDRGRGRRGADPRLGEPAGVIQLLDRHQRACEAFAERLAVPLHVVPVCAAGDAVRGAAGAPEPVVGRGGALVAGAARCSSARTCSARCRTSAPESEPVGLHPFLRLCPPSVAARAAAGAPARGSRRGAARAGTWRRQSRRRCERGGGGCRGGSSGSRGSCGER